MSAQIQLRQLSKSEAKEISREIALTPNITAYTPRQLQKIGPVLVIQNDAEIIGILAFTQTTQFVDFKIFIIKEAYRNRGYGSKLFRHFMNLERNTTVPIYTVTKNPVLVAMLRTAGFQKTVFYRLPIRCQAHQLKMVFSLYRIKEFIRKSLTLKGEAKFTYWIKP
jgi:N-acetylglutamate synthase-like GNAT family acetyltransferase